jgi:hypothetical protein
LLSPAAPLLPPPLPPVAPPPSPPVRPQPAIAIASAKLNLASTAARRPWSHPILGQSDAHNGAQLRKRMKNATAQ